MQVKIALFGITKEIIGSSQLDYQLEEQADVNQLLHCLKTDYPGLQKLTSLLIAVNDDYATADQKLTARDEIALIPPVCGG